MWSVIKSDVCGVSEGHMTSGHMTPGCWSCDLVRDKCVDVVLPQGGFSYLFMLVAYIYTMFSIL